MSDQLQRLWSPHRMSYITAEPRPADSTGHPFLDIPRMSDEDVQRWIGGDGRIVPPPVAPAGITLRRTGLAAAQLFGQIDLEDLTGAESAELMAFTQRTIRVIKAVSSPDAFNVGLNLGAAAGGSLSEHIHQHIVPRWTGDANFITVVGNTKVLPQLLRDTRSLLSAKWQELR